MRQAHRRASTGARRNPEAGAAILAAARALLMEEGYRGFSIEEVARRAGAGKPTIYRWWPSRAALFLAVYEQEKKAAIAMAHTPDILEDFIAYCDSLFAFWRDNAAGRAFKGLIAEAQGSDAAMALLKERFLPERVEALRQRLLIAADRGSLAQDEIEPRLALIVSFFWFSLLTDQLTPDPATIRAIFAVIVPSSIDALRMENPRS